MIEASKIQDVFWKLGWRIRSSENEKRLKTKKKYKQQKMVLEAPERKKTKAPDKDSFCFW